MKEQIKEAIFEAVEEFNESCEPEQRLEPSLDTVLFGRRGKLDSMGLVNFVVTLEAQLEDRFDLTLTLADPKAMSQRNSPFKSLGALADFIAQRLEEARRG